MKKQISKKVAVSPTLIYIYVILDSKLYISTNINKGYDIQIRFFYFTIDRWVVEVFRKET